jgi:glucose/arabinose dehydrogenase
MTRVEFGAFYGWPYSYWGGYEDKRVEPRPDLLQYTKRPDYALGPHTASLGLAFGSLGAFRNGMFVGQHGSWNRVPVSGYKVVFVPFGTNGYPDGAMQDVLTGFLDKDGGAQGRPVGVIVDKAGALLVADDVGNRIWRVSAR